MRESGSISKENDFDRSDVAYALMVARKLGENGMITEENLAEYYSQLESFYKKALSDVEWHLRQLSEKRGGDFERIINSSTLKPRVKEPDSILDKCRRWRHGRY